MSIGFEEDGTGGKLEHDGRECSDVLVVSSETIDCEKMESADDDNIESTSERADCMDTGREEYREISSFGDEEAAGDIEEVVALELPFPRNNKSSSVSSSTSSTISSASSSKVFKGKSSSSSSHKTHIRPR